MFNFTIEWKYALSWLECFQHRKRKPAFHSLSASTKSLSYLLCSQYSSNSPPLVLELQMLNEHLSSATQKIKSNNQAPADFFLIDCLFGPFRITFIFIKEWTRNPFDTVITLFEWIFEALGHFSSSHNTLLYYSIAIHQWVLTRNSLK